jgi:hypothetical protein
MADPDPERVCEVCSKPVRLEEPVAFQDGKIVHLGCGTRAAVLRAMELEAEAQAERDQAARAAEVARRIIATARRHRTGEPAEPPAA